MHMKSLIMIAALGMQGGVRGILPVPAQSPAVETQTVDIQDLLASARGVAPAVCALAADGASGWGNGSDAPDLSVRANVHALLRDLRNTAFTTAEAQVLLGGLASSDPCERHLAGTLIGRSGDRSFVPALLDDLHASGPD